MAAIQAAVLSVKLRHLEGWLERRRKNAARYDLAIAGPELRSVSDSSDVRHAVHIYALRAENRDLAVSEFRRRGIETRVHYPKPIHLLEGATDLGYRKGDFPVAEAAATQVISIPVHPELSSSEVEAVAEAISAISESRGHARPAGQRLPTHADKRATG
jgi:dTDP-4-amino-4,6-dideoxygalactose transaminase